MILETRIFTCFVLTLILIFLTGCSTTKWEWTPDKYKDNQIVPYKDGIEINVVKITF